MTASLVEHFQTASTNDDADFLFDGRLVLAFGIEPPQAGIPGAEVAMRLIETFGGVALVTALALALGWFVRLGVARDGYGSTRLRRRYSFGGRLLTVISLAVYAWIIHSVGWSRLVRTNWVSEISSWLMIF